MAVDGGGQQKWKHKYFETLEQLERQELEWRGMNESLRHGLSRLALVSTGLNSGLDVQLKELRKNLQDHGSRQQLDEIVNKISVYLKTLDEQIDPKTTVQDQTPLDLLIELAESIEFPAAHHIQARRLLKALKSHDAADHLKRLTAEFSKLIVSAFYPDASVTEQLESAENSALSEPEEQKKSSWWKRIFSNSEYTSVLASEASVEPEKAVTTANTIEPVSLNEPRVPVSNSETDSHMLEKTLLDFLEHLSIPPQFSEQAQNLRDTLVAGLSSDVVDPLVKGLVSLVTDVQQQLESEKEALEEFLKQLTQRLQELDAMADGAETERLASLTSGRKLDEMVKAEVNDIEQTVQTVDDVIEMKKLIQGSLESIRLHFAEKQSQEEAHQHSLENQLKGLNLRLEQMESESEQLRKRLIMERRQAMTDPLTNVPNRLGYEKRISHEFARWQRYGNPLTVLLCDIDHFKRINDTYGHRAGDRALMAIAKTIDQPLRETDFVARIGGEEFIVLLPEISLEDAIPAAEKLRTAVEACEFVYEGAPVPITMSGGIASFSEGDTIDSVYQRADKALYLAKKQGRNCFMTV